MELKGIAILPTNPKLNERLERDLILKIIQNKPKSLIFVYPDGNAFRDNICIDYLLSCTLGDKTYSSDMGILDDLHKILLREKIPALFLNPELYENYELSQQKPVYLEHFLKLLDRVYPEYKVVCLSSGDLPVSEELEIGRSLREAVERSGSSSVLVVFSDLIDSPIYREILKADIESDDFLSFLSIKPKPDEEDNFNSLLIGIGATDSLLLKPEIFSKGEDCCYYLKFKVESVDLKNDKQTEFTTQSIIEKWKEAEKEQMAELRANESVLQKMVRETLKYWLTQRRRLNFKMYAEIAGVDDKLIERMELQRTGVFVTILKNGRYRGSMGTVNPAFDNIGEEIINNTIEAAFFDPQFVPVTLEEMDQLSFEVDVLNPPEEVEELSELDPKEYGLIVEQGFKRGVVLPNIRGIDSVEDQLELAKARAGIDETIDSLEPLIISKFSTETF